MQKINTISIILLVYLLGFIFLYANKSYAISQAEVDKIIKVVDDRQQNSGDYKAICYIDNKEKGKKDVIYEAIFYRRDASDQFMILFTKPKDEKGKGYLRLGNNLWMYDPNTGKWERRTESERIAGTDSRRSDFDESRLSEEYNAKFLGADKLGKFDVYKIKLTAKDGVDVSYPVKELWIDQKTNNILKAMDFSLSNKLMRTTYYPKWKYVFSQSKGDNVWYPEEIRIFDEIEKGNTTVVLIKEVDLNPLKGNIFTKAYLESKSK